MKTTFLRRGLALALAATVVVGNLAAQPKLAKPEKVRFVYNVAGAMGVSSIVFFISVNKGFLEQEFAKDGIQVEYVPTAGSSGTSNASILGAGKADFCQIGDQPVMVSRANGIDIKAVGVYAQGLLSGPDRYIALVKRKGSTINGLQDLRGKKVATTVGTNQHVVLERLLNSAGLKPKDIQLVNMESADVRTALASGTLEVGTLSQPNLGIALTQGFAEIVPDSAGLTRNYNVIVVRHEFADQYPDVVKKVLQVHQKSQKWINENHEEFLDIASKSLKLDRELVRTVLRGCVYDLAVTDDTIKSFGITQDFLVANGLSRGGTDPKDAFDLRFLKELGVIK